MTDSDESLSFLQEFWELRIDQKDVESYARLQKMRALQEAGKSTAEIERELSTGNVGKYLRGEKKPFLESLKEASLSLGPPKENCRWLPVKLKPKGIPGDRWICVPVAISSFDDIPFVISQRESLAVVGEVEEKAPSLDERVRAFGFYLGALIGDAGKHPKGKAHFESLANSMVLSSGKENSLAFGEFTSKCLRVSLGLGMRRTADVSPSSSRFTKKVCFRWGSESSPLLAWVFHVCLGLGQDELTTYNQLKMDWLLTSPASFRIAVLQGICESDGWVDAGSDTLCIVSSPNSVLFSKILKSLGIRHRMDRQEKVEVTRVSTEDAARCELFNPTIGSRYFHELQWMAKATRVPSRIRISPEIVSRIRAAAMDGMGLSQVCLALAREHGIKVSGATVRKYLATGSST